jgi:hypothetical protein
MTTATEQQPTGTRGPLEGGVPLVTCEPVAPAAPSTGPSRPRITRQIRAANGSLDT